MAYSNPFPYIPGAPAPMRPQPPQFNPNQFAQLAITLNQPALERLISLARMQGISDTDISAGLDIIKSLR